MHNISALLLLAWASMASAKPVVVFDIDGTLTPNVITIWDARDDAALAAYTYAQEGVSVVYLSARMPLFQDGVPDWLDKSGFPKGDVRLIPADRDLSEAAAFKEHILREIQNEGGQIIAAYGDSSSDFAAYAAVGIPQRRVFALRRLGYSACETGVWQVCYDDWATHLPLIHALIGD